MSATPIKTGICSYGMSGKLFHAPFIQAHPGFELTAIVERHKTDSRTLYPNSILYKSVDELIADSAIELIVVNTPVQTHFEFAKAAILAGKSVVVEKAFTVTVAEAKKRADGGCNCQIKNLLLVAIKIIYWQVVMRFLRDGLERRKEVN